MVQKATDLWQPERTKMSDLSETGHPRVFELPLTYPLSVGTASMFGFDLVEEERLVISKLFQHTVMSMTRSESRLLAT